MVNYWLGYCSRKRYDLARAEPRVFYLMYLYTHIYYLSNRLKLKNEL